MLLSGLASRRYFYEVDVLASNSFVSLTDRKIFGKGVRKGFSTG